MRYTRATTAMNERINCISGGDEAADKSAECHSSVDSLGQGETEEWSMNVLCYWVEAKKSSTKSKNVQKQEHDT